MKFSDKFYHLFSLSLVLWCIFSGAPSSVVAARDNSQQGGNPQRKPKPINAVEAIISSFDRIPLVALGEAHSLQEEHDFIEKLLSHPQFAAKVNDIVVEFGNARYQDLLDRYIRGEQVSLTELRQVWRNTTVSPLQQWDSPMYEKFFATVREINQRLPPDRHLRVLAGDPPIDWNAVSTREDVIFWGFQRDQHYASVVISQVLSKNRKALLIAGLMHFTRRSSTFPGAPPGPKNALQVIEQQYPNSTFVIAPHTGFGDKNYDLEPRLLDWDKQSLTLVERNWLGSLDPRSIFKDTFIIGQPGNPNPPNPWEGLKFEDLVDAYLYLGRHDELTLSMPSPFIYRDDAYYNELNRRNQIMTGRPLNNAQPQYFVYGIPNTRNLPPPPPAP